MDKGPKTRIRHRERQAASQIQVSRELLDDAILLQLEDNPGAIYTSCRLVRF